MSIRLILNIKNIKEIDILIRNFEIYFGNKIMLCSILDQRTLISLVTINWI